MVILLRSSCSAPWRNRFSKKLILDVILATEVEGGRMIPLAWSLAQTHSYSCSPSSKTIGNAFWGKSSFWCFFLPRKWRGSHDPSGSGLRPPLTHIRGPHARKPLETSFHAKVGFDVLLTPEVGVGHMTPLEVIRDRSTLISMSTVRENHEKRVFRQK